MEGTPPPDESIPSLVTQLIDDGKEFVRAEITLYRIRLMSRVGEARNAVILGLVALWLVQAALVTALVGLLIMLREPLGSGGATAVAVAVGLVVAGLLGWLAWGQVQKAIATKDRDSRK